MNNKEEKVKNILELDKMTSLQFDILDELYFIMSFNDVKDIVGISSDVLELELDLMIKKAWIKCYDRSNLEISLDKIDIKEFSQYCFLASKSGLMAHNSIK